MKPTPCLLRTTFSKELKELEEGISLMRLKQAKISFPIFTELVPSSGQLPHVVMPQTVRNVLIFFPSCFLSKVVYV